MSSCRVFFFSFCQHRITTTINCLFVSVFEVSSWLTIYCSFAAPLNNLRKMKKTEHRSIRWRFLSPDADRFHSFRVVILMWLNSTHRLWIRVFSVTCSCLHHIRIHILVKIKYKIIGVKHVFAWLICNTIVIDFFTQKFQNNFWNHTT